MNDNTEQLIKDIKHLIAKDCCDETIAKRIAIFINERDQKIEIVVVCEKECGDTHPSRGGNPICLNCGSSIKTESPTFQSEVKYKYEAEGLPPMFMMYILALIFIGSVVSISTIILALIFK